MMNNPIEDLQRVAALRYRAYARHVPEFANQLTTAEAADIDPNTLVLLVESKSSTTAGGGGSVRDNADSHQPS